MKIFFINGISEQKALTEMLSSGIIEKEILRENYLVDFNEEESTENYRKYLSTLSYKTNAESVGY